jgi:fatty acid synthase, animal type
MALEFPGVTSVWDCRFESAFILDPSVPAATLKVAQEGNRWSVKSSSVLRKHGVCHVSVPRSYTNQKAWTTTIHGHAQSHISTLFMRTASLDMVNRKFSPELSLTSTSTMSSLVRKSQLRTKKYTRSYQESHNLGQSILCLFRIIGPHSSYNYRFRRIQKICANDTEVIAWIKGHGDTLTRTGYFFHPALMDAVFQVSTFTMTQKCCADSSCRLV